MAADFSRTLRSLHSQQSGSGAIIALAAWLLIGGWIFWFARASITLYETSEQATIQTKTTVRRVQSPLAGVLLENNIRLGQRVVSGQLLAKLDDQKLQLALKTLRQKQTSTAALIEQVEREIAAEQAALEAQNHAALAAAEEQQTRIAAAHTHVETTRRKADRLKKLWEQMAVAEQKYEQAEAEAKLAKTKTLEAEAALAVLRAQAEANRSDRLTQLAGLALKRQELQEQAEILKTEFKQQQHEITRREIRAPATGRIGQVGDFPVGSALDSGAVLASIVPAGEPRVVAHFPAQALGRLETGQTARLRLKAFPWTQYGGLNARVVQVGNELRDGKARVELELLKTSSSIPIQHGLAGSLEVEIDRVSPLTLVLRSLGRR